MINCARGAIALLLLAAPGAARAQGAAGSSAQLRLSVQTAGLDGSFSREDDVSASTASQTAAELFARVDGIGIVLRSHAYTVERAGVQVADLGIREARLLLGTPRLSVELGVLERGVAGAPTADPELLGRAGLRSQWGIGGSGVMISLSAGVHLESVDEGTSGRSAGYRGHDGEALVIVQAPRRIPVFAAVGWRVLALDDERSTPNSVHSHSGPVLALGLKLGR